MGDSEKIELLVLRESLRAAVIRANEMEADARRYRWLRAEHATDGPSWHVRRPSNCPAEKDLDAAIDAFLSEQAGEQENGNG